MCISGVLIVMNEQWNSAKCQERDEYANRQYYKDYQNLTEIPNDIPIQCLNPITKIQANVFSRLSRCTYMNLNNNEIYEVEPGAFNGLTSLTSFHFGNNPMERLHVNMFSELSSRLFLALDHNRIIEIEPGSFNGLHNARRILLSLNRLIVLNSGMFQGLANLQSFELNENDIESIEDNTVIRQLEDNSDIRVSLESSGNFKTRDVLRFPTDTTLRLQPFDNITRRCIQSSA